MKAACVGTGSCNISMGCFCAGIGIIPAAFKPDELPIPFLHPAENRFGAPPALFVTGMCPCLYGDVVKPRIYIGNASVPSLVFLHDSFQDLLNEDGTVGGVSSLPGSHDAMGEATISKRHSADDDVMKKVVCVILQPVIRRWGRFVVGYSSSCCKACICCRAGIANPKENAGSYWYRYPYWVLLRSPHPGNSAHAPERSRRTSHSCCVGSTSP